MHLAESMGDKPKHQPRFVVTKTLEVLSFESEQAQTGISDCQPDYEVAVTKTEGNCSLFSITATDSNNHQESGNTGSSRKRRRALLQTLLKEGEDATDGGETCKKRRTRWCDDASQLKMLGPIKLPDFVTDVDNCLKADPEVQALNIKLVELNKKLQGSRPVDDLPDKKRSLAKRMNSRMRYRNRLLENRREIILRLVRKNPTFRPQPTVKPPKFQRKLYIPVKEYPDYNFIGPIIGPYGHNQKRMERETGAHIVVRGNGLVKGGKGQKHEPKRCSVDNEDLHVLVEADNEGSVDAAVKLVEQFLVPVGGLNDSSILDPWSEGSAFGASLPSEATKTKIGENPSVDSDSVHEENLFVAYLPESVEEGGLMKMFSPFGTVVHVRVARDPTTGLSKCYGFVKFSDQFSAARAAECMNGQEIDGKMLTVKIRRTPKPFLCPGACPGNSSTADKGLRHCSWPIPPGSILLPKSSSKNRSHCYSGPYTSTKQHKYDIQIRNESLQDTLINLQPQVHNGPF